MGRQNFHSTVDGLPVVKSVFMGLRSPSRSNDFIQITLFWMSCFQISIINPAVRSVKCRFFILWPQHDAPAGSFLPCHRTTMNQEALNQSVRADSGSCGLIQSFPNLLLFRVPSWYDTSNKQSRRKLFPPLSGLLFLCESLSGGWSIWFDFSLLKISCRMTQNFQ